MDEAGAKIPSTHHPSQTFELGNPSNVVGKDLEEDQYPHGVKLIVLASASIVAVFLIALDQVRGLLSILRVLSVNRNPDHRRYSYP